MIKNMGSLDRVIRLAVVALIVMAFAMGKIVGTLALVLGIVAAIFLLTTAIGFCPLYRMVGLSTCRKS